MTTAHEEYCREHCENRARIARSESDIQNVWTAVDGIKEAVSAIMVKVSMIVGGATVLSVAAQIGIAVWAGSRQP